MQQQAVVHLELRTAANNLAFQFKLDNRHSFLHLRNQTNRFLVERSVRTSGLGQEQFARVVGIRFHRKGCKGKEVDAVAILQCRQIPVAQTHADDIRDAPHVAGSRAHPQDVVVAPLDVEVMVIAYRIHDDMRAGTPVVNVADDMQQVDRQPLNQIADGDDELIRPPGRDNRIDNLIDVCRLIRLRRRLMQ